MEFRPSNCWLSVGCQTKRQWCSLKWTDTPRRRIVSPITPMVKKLILAVKEGEFPVVGYFAGLPFLLSSSHAEHSIEEGGADSSRSSVGMVITCPHAR